MFRICRTFRCGSESSGHWSCDWADNKSRKKGAFFLFLRGLEGFRRTFYFGGFSFKYLIVISLFWHYKQIKMNTNTDLLTFKCSWIPLSLRTAQNCFNFSSREVTKRCYLPWLTNSASYLSPNAGGVGADAGSHPMSTVVHMEPK